MKLIDLEKIFYIDWLIQKEKTGKPVEFANKINVSRSTLFEYLSYMREVLQLKIKYDYNKESYYYEDGNLLMMFKNKCCSLCKEETKLNL